MSKRSIASLTFLSLFILLTNISQASTLINGGFESGTSPPDLNSFKTLNAGSTDLTGWQIGFGSIDWVGNGYWNTPDGSYSIDLNGTGTVMGGQIYQTFATSVGQQYRLDFWYAGTPAASSVTELAWRIVSGSLGDYVEFYSVSSIPIGSGPPYLLTWHQDSFLFTALTNSTTLYFSSAVAGNSGVALDGFSINAVPIPTAAWLLASGLVGLVALKRKYKP